MENTNTPTSSFSVTPMSQEIELEAGQTYTGSITVINPVDAQSDFSYIATVTPYSVIGRDYTIDLAEQSNSSLIASWITIDNPTGTISPNQSAKINFTITVPEGVPSGGQYATITVGSSDQGSKSEGFSIQNDVELASIIYAKVAGETIHDGNILENNIPGFVLQSPITISTLIDNHGNVHEPAYITVKAQNVFTGEVILPTVESTGSYTEVIMPDTERYSAHDLDTIPYIGIVHVEQSVHYLDSTWTEVKDVIICPLWLIILGIAIIFAIIGTIIGVIVRHHRKKVKEKYL